MLQLIALVIGILGLLPLLNAGRALLLGRFPTRELLRLANRARLDIVVTTNARQRPDAGVAGAYLTAVGEVRGVAAASRVLTRVYPRKTTVVHLSEDYSGNPEGDLLLLGGPRRNRWSRHFVERFNRQYSITLVLDAENRMLRVHDFAVEAFDQRPSSGIPTEDIGLVIIAPWSPDRKQHVIFCGGLSTYGTEAAARFIFSDLHRDRKLRGRINRLANSNDAVIIGIHCYIEARSVQQTAILTVEGREMIWAGRRC